MLIVTAILFLKRRSDNIDISHHLCEVNSGKMVIIVFFQIIFANVTTSDDQVVDLTNENPNVMITFSYSATWKETK